MNALWFLSRRRLAGVAAIACALVMATPALVGAQPAPLAAGEQLIATLGDEAIRLLGNNDMSRDDRRAAFEELIDANFAIPTMSRFAIGRTWNQMSEAQRDDYNVLFRRALIQAYEGRLERYDGQTLDVVDTRPTVDDRDALVTSLVREPGGGETVEVIWRVRDDNGSAQVIDVIVEDVSLLITQRDDFSALLARNGNDVEALLADLRQRTANW